MIFQEIPQVLYRAVAKTEKKEGKKKTTRQPERRGMLLIITSVRLSS